MKTFEVQFRFRDRSEETELAAAYVVMLAEAVLVVLFIAMAAVWLALASGQVPA